MTGSPRGIGLGSGDAEITEPSCTEIPEGLIALVAGVDLEDFAVRRLIGRICADPEALESFIQVSLSHPARMAALRKTGLLDDGANTGLDGVASLTADALGVSFAAVTLVSDDRQLLAGCNITAEYFQRSRPLELSLCKFAVVSGIPFIIDDTAAHPLVADHPAVAGGEVGSYAGVPLFSDDSKAVGTLCVWETGAHRWTSGQILLLQDMADLARAKIFESA